MMEDWIRRDAEPALARLGSQRPVVVVTGARQTGKTSLVRRVFPKHSFVSLDLPAEAEQAEKDPQGFLARHRTPIIIDEVQYAPGMFRHLKAAVDARRKDNGQFILTGSQKFTLMQAVSESLAGRVGLLELEGFGLPELRNAGVNLRTESILVRGALPELYEKPGLDAAEFYRAYAATYLERDLRSLLAVSSLRDFERFIRACALRSAKLLNKAELARDVGISPSTAAEWLSALETSNQIMLLEPWFSNGTLSLVKTPKLYLCDTGLLCFLLGITSARDLFESPLVGSVWETFVCAEIRRAIRYGHLHGDLFFWRDRTKEVDFLIHRGGRFELFEAKWTEHPDRHDISALVKVIGELPARSVKHGAVICRAANRYPLERRIEAVGVEDIVTAAYPKARGADSSSSGES